MLNQAQLPLSFWGAAVQYLAHILNSTPSSSLSNTTSYAVWNDRKPDLSMYRVFGCRVYVNILRKDRKNLEPHTNPCVFIGFSDGYKGWKCYDPETKKIVIARDVVFDETVFPGLSTKTKPQNPPPPVTLRDVWLDDDAPTDAHKQDGPEGPAGAGGDAGSDSEDNDDDPFPGDKDDEEEDDDDDKGPATPKRAPGEPTATTPKRERKPFQPSSTRPASPTPKAKDPTGDHIDTDQSDDEHIQRPNFGRPPPPPSRIPVPSPAPAPTPPPPAPARKAPKKAPAAVSQSTRPVRKATINATDYQILGGKGRRGTVPAPRREYISDDEDDGAADRGGDQENDDPPLLTQEAINPPPLTQSDFEDEDEDNPVDMEDALRATSITNSLYDVYDVHLGEIIPLEHGIEMCFAMAVDKHQKAFGAATRPHDAPRTFKEAISGPDADKWIDATQAEMNAHETNGTWELAELPEGRKVIGSRWVFIIKRKADGTIDKYKARLVAQGFSQMPGVDYDQTFSPTVRLSALRVILAQICREGEFLESIDISNAYLNGKMEDKYQVFMRQAEGYEVISPQGKKMVCFLKKGIYGLKQGGRLWNQKLSGELEHLGFTQIKSDPSIYIWEADGVRVIIPVFVDDITIASKSQEKIRWVKESLAKIFKLKDLGPTSFLLGIKIDYDQENCILRLSQRQYIVDILKRFNMSDCAPVSTPMDPGNGSKLRRYVPDPKKRVDMSRVPYMSAVGALMYLAIATRPDITYSVSKLAQYNSNPGPEHWQAVKHLLRYLKGTMDLQLTYRGDERASPEVFRAYSDADHAGCLDTRRSTSGFLIKMGSGAVSWSAKKQTTVADSSTEAEYVSASSAGREILWMRNLLTEIGVEVKGPSPLMVDNQSALRVLKNPEHHGRMKHIDVKYHWVRDSVKRGDIEVHFLPTHDMIADIFTKPLPRAAVEQHRLALGLESP